MIRSYFDEVKKNFGTANEESIHHMSVEEAALYERDGAFEDGTMKPKIKAAVDFLSSNPEGKVLITSLDAVADALAGKNGTVITTK